MPPTVGYSTNRSESSSAQDERLLCFYSNGSNDLNPPYRSLNEPTAAPRTPRASKLVVRSALHARLLASVQAMFILKRSLAAQRCLSRSLFIGTRSFPPLSLQPAISSKGNRKLSSLPTDAKVTPLAPRTFAVSGFEPIDPSCKIEEETLSFYDPRMFYPVRLGEIFKERYQVVTKLGWGAHSTIWLCHDLQYALLPYRFSLNHNE